MCTLRLLLYGFCGTELLDDWLPIVYRLLPPSQIINHFDFSKYVNFAMHLDIIYIYI
jgi:hypothetical protein